MLSDDLLELQGIDTSIDQIAHRRTNLAERRTAAAAKADLDRNAGSITAMIARQRELTDIVDEAERQGEALNTKRSRLEAQLRTIVSPREAEALMHELETLATDRDALEDTELEHLEEQSALIDELAAAHAAKPDLEAASAAAAAALAAVEKELDTETAELTIKRSETVKRIEGGVLTDYERRRARNGGVAVARLDGRRCTGCNLDLSTSELEQVRSTPVGELADCPQCGRMLVP